MATKKKEDQGTTQRLNLPYKIRGVLYVATSIGTPIVAYLFARHSIGELEVTLWSAEVAVVTALAALNTAPKKGEL